jgi:hypothetical protein
VYVYVCVCLDRQITGPELLQFMKVYTKMFEAGESSFPKAMTMLEATAGEASNDRTYMIHDA